jgi:uncharacterized protein YbcI
VSTQQPATRHVASPARVGAFDVRTDAQAGQAVQSGARPQVSDDGDPIIPGAGGLTAERDRPKGGELNAAVTSALVGIHTEHLGRGPRSASTFHHGPVLVTLMHDVLAPAEKSLARTNRGDAVKHIRQLYQEAMATDFCAAVERLTGQKVVAFISGNHIEPDIAAELFILDEPL